MGPVDEQDLAAAREARLELVVRAAASPRACPSTSSSTRAWAGSATASSRSRRTTSSGLMTHLATADSDRVFAERQLDAFGAATERYPTLLRHAANSAAALQIPSARFDAARCGVALYGLSPFGTDPAEDGLEPVLSLAHAAGSGEGASSGAEHGLQPPLRRGAHTWIGLVPVGYADGFRRDLTGTQVLIAGEALPRRRHRSRWTRSRSSCPVSSRSARPSRSSATASSSEEHARHAGTINYEITSRIESSPERADREVVDA